MRPGSAEEAAELLRDADGPVRPQGAGTKPWGPAGDDAQVLDTRGLGRIVEHNAGDFTAVLEAGVALAEAQEAFAAHGQMLALDPPGEASTLGGIMATADSGPLRHRYGAIRDLVVGVTVALSDGTLATSGGRVIKNVAGYDVAKLLCGSYGTLGVIVRVAVRLHPRPDRTATAVLEREDPDALGALAVSLAGQPLEADCLDVDWRDGRGRMLVRFSGPTAAERAAQLGTVVEDDGELWAQQRARQRAGAEPCVLKVSGRITDLPAVCRAGAAVAGRAGLGLYWLQVEPDGVDAARAALAPRPCVLLDAPPELRERAWPEPEPALRELSARVKRRFDPLGRLRPGALAGGA